MITSGHEGKIDIGLFIRIGRDGCMWTMPGQGSVMEKTYFFKRLLSHLSGSAIERVA